MRILLIEDETAIAAVVKKGLERAHYQVEVADDGESGLERAIEGGWALILLDLMLPKRDGLSVCQALRARRDRTPIIMLTARDAVPDRVKGLETGADDYLPKPFAFEELLARVRSQIRREGVHRAGVLNIRDLEIDTNARRVRQDGDDLALTPREYALLETLAQNEGRTLSRETILNRVWGDIAATGSNSVDVYITMLRRKIDSGVPEPQRLIHTVHGIGYVLRRPIEPKAP
jgi:two-component system copper resistance phosphate regulon response regulator CusR